MFHESLQLFISVLAISILHAILPNHWLPVVALSRQFGWTGRKTAGITMLAALAHSLSTVIIGILVALGGMALDEWLPYFKYVAAGILIALGLLFVWRHQHHMHFHLREFKMTGQKSMWFIIGSLLMAMFLSPCLEVGALFLLAGTESLQITMTIAAIYTITSAVGMTLFAWLAMQGLKKIDWHKVEHNSGLISGIILILTGVFFIFSH
jgi:cytochrome c biogenesis protein CcdA